MTTVTVTNVKGGTTKSTSTVILAKKFAARGKRVLLLDLDIQCNSTATFDQDEEVFNFDDPDSNDGRIFGGRSIMGIFKDRSLIRECIYEVSPTFHIIPGSADLLTQANISENYIAKAIKPLQNDYDYVFIDTPATWDWIVKCGIYAGDILISTVLPGRYNYDSIKLFKSQLEMEFDEKLDSWFILLSRIKTANQVHQRFFDFYRSRFANTLDVRIPETEAVHKRMRSWEPVVTPAGARLEEEFGKLIAFIEERSN